MMTGSIAFIFKATRRLEDAFDEFHPYGAQVRRGFRKFRSYDRLQDRQRFHRGSRSLVHGWRMNGAPSNFPRCGCISLASTIDCSSSTAPSKLNDLNDRHRYHHPQSPLASVPRRQSSVRLLLLLVSAAVTLLPP
jgi:hypothetical protein